MFTGNNNQGLQVGHNSGHVESHFHAPAERPETPPQPTCFVPFRRDPHFVDRATLLDQIRERCSAPAARVALVGLGGVGKSQLAIEHCHRTAERSPETWVLWAHASNHARLQQSYHEIAELVKVRGRKHPQADVFKLVHNWLRNEKNAPWLLIFDNADNTDDDDNAALCSSPLGDSRKSQTHDGTGVALRQHLSRYPLPSRHGSVLLTSRTKRAAMQIVEENDIILVEPMDSVAAHTLLYRNLGDAVDGNDGIAELAAELNYMPLALVQAAAYIRQRASRCSVRQYLDDYQQSDSRKTSLLKHGAGHLHRDGAASNAILLTWQISFDHIRRSRQSAADLLSLMSFFDRQGIQDALLRDTSSTANALVSDVAANDRFEDDVVTLRDYSFITVTKDAKTFEMHSLVQLATREWLKSQEQLDKWKEQFISNLCAELLTVADENWEKCELLHPHAKAALAQRPKSCKSLEEWALLLYRAAWYACRRGRTDEAEHMSVVSMEVRSEVLGEESPETMDSMELVASAKDLGGKYKEAEAMNRQTLARREKVLGPEHPDTLQSMGNLAAMLHSQGKYKEAEVMNRQKLAQQEKVLGHEHPDTLLGMNNLALVLDGQGKYKEAEVMSWQTLARREKVLGCQCHFDESFSLYQRACAGFSVVLGEDHPITRACRQHRSEMLASQEQTRIALSPATPDNSASTHTGTVSILSRWLAKLEIWGSKSVTR